MKALLGSAVFLVSLYLMRQILVGTGLLSPTLALVFMVAVVGIPLGGIIFLESAFDLETRKLRSEVRGLREDVERLGRCLPGGTETCETPEASGTPATSATLETPDPPESTRDDSA